MILYNKLFWLLVPIALTSCRSATTTTITTTFTHPTVTNAIPTQPQPIETTRINPTEPIRELQIIANIPVNRPANITVENELVWVISGSSIICIDPTTNTIVGNSISAGVQNEGDITFNDGSIWVSSVSSGDLGDENDRDFVSRIDPMNGELITTIRVSRGPLSINATPGKIWVTHFGGVGDSVIQIDTKTNQILGEPIQTGLAPISIAVGDGSVWVANHDVGTVTRIDPDTGNVLADIKLTSEPHRITFGEGYIWISNWHDNSVTQIDPVTNQLVGAPIDIGFPAGNIAAGLGSVWVTSDYRVDGKPTDVVLVQIDPNTQQVIERIAVGGHPIDVALTEDAVWVTVQNPDMIVRINP